jgi:hypothetical protein
MGTAAYRMSPDDYLGENTDDDHDYRGAEGALD